jgi:hypothetical protein
MGLPGKGMALGVRQSLQRHTNQSLIYPLDMRGPEPGCAEVARQKLNKAEMRCNEIIRQVMPP